eukprot:symbB.v1.2.004556.t1/scaffold245.1/size253980/13
MSLRILMMWQLAVAYWCPPLPSERPSDCRRQSQKVGGGTGVRSLYDGVAATLTPLTDLLELGVVPDDRLDLYFRFAEFLKHLLQMLCVMDFKGCYEDYWPMAENVCQQVDKDCHSLGFCHAGVNICGTLYQDAGVALGNLIQELRMIVMEQVDENGVLLSASKSEDTKIECLPRSPARILGLNGRLQTLSAKERPFFTRHRILEVISKDADTLQNYVVNLGAAELRGCLDSASCLIRAGWPGIMLECNYNFSQKLRETYTHRKDVQILNQCLSPDTWVNAVISAVWNAERVLPSMSLPFPAFLKIDVDNGDCDFLESWLSSGYRPLFVEMELIHSFVPPEIEVSFSYKHVGQEDLSQVRADSCMFKGCSLGKVISTLGPDYSLLSWSYDKELNAQFVLDTWAREHDVLVVPHSEFSSFWRRAVSFREVWDDHNWHGIDLPLEFLLSNEHSIEAKQAALNATYDIVIERQVLEW